MNCANCGSSVTIIINRHHGVYIGSMTCDNGECGASVMIDDHTVHEVVARLEKEQESNP